MLGAGGGGVGDLDVLLSSNTKDKMRWGRGRLSTDFRKKGEMRGKEERQEMREKMRGEQGRGEEGREINGGREQNRVRLVRKGTVRRGAPWVQAQANTILGSQANP